MEFVIAILGIIILIPLLFVIIGYLLSGGNYTGPASDHFNGKRFQNPSRRKANSFKQVGEYVQKREPDKWTPNPNAYVRTETPPLPDPNDIQYIFVNHSSFLIQHQGLNILTDPIWSKRCSPFQFIGPQRQRPPGLDFSSLPKIDIVLISHNHYDHLDKGTIKKLNKDHEPTYVVPLGVDIIMKKWGCKKVKSLDWWQSISVDSLHIHSAPANHFSSRGTFDRNTTLWCGYIIKSEDKTIYYVGDTGYGDNFKLIPEKFPSIDLSFIPIGAFKPEWFMGPIHVTPEEAVEIHKDVQSKKSVAMHFGTFPLADDNPERAIKRLIASLSKNQIGRKEFIIPEEGKIYIN